MQPDRSKMYDFINKGKSSMTPIKRCYETHPPLPIPGTALVIYGGSCSRPVVEDADVYIGFDSSMQLTSRSWPWTPQHEVYFPITDMSVPKHVGDFKKLLDWTRVQLEAGRKVHCGCIGGHGRTGMFLSALVSLYGEADAITYVRKNYCHKAVESTTQVDFLHKHFGIVKAQGTKSSYAGWDDYPAKKAKTSATLKFPDERYGKGRVYEPIKSKLCIW